MAQLISAVTVLFAIGYHAFTLFSTMNELTDWLHGAKYTGIFTGAVTGLLRLVYQRGLFDGFVAGALLVLIAKRERSK